MVIRGLELWSWVGWGDLKAWEICWVTRDGDTSSGEKGLDEIGSVGVDVIRVAADSAPPDGQIKGDAALGG